MIHKGILITAALLAMFMVSGCEGNSPNTYIDNFTSDLKDRLSMNQQEVVRLEQAGLLSKEASRTLQESIERQWDRLENLSISEISTVTTKVNSENSSAPLTPWVKAFNASERKEHLSIISEDSDAMKELRKNLEFEIYVLKRDVDQLNLGENSLSVLDRVSDEVQKAIDGKTSDIDKYFVGTNKNVWDLNDPHNRIIRDTDDNPEYSFPHNFESSNILGLDYIGVKVEYDEETGERYQSNGIEIVLREFSPEAIDRLLGTDGVNKDKYVIIGNKCYLMEYPVYYVAGFKTEADNKFVATYEKSQMRINILTKEMMDNQGRKCTPGNNESIMSVTGVSTTNYTDLGRASFVVDGIPGEEPKEGYLEEGQMLTNEKDYGRVVLRDYLELNYMPDVVEGESLVAAGRRVRLTKFRGEGDAEIGIFIDRNGDKAQNSMNIKITDIMDIAQGIGSGSKYKLDIKVTDDNTSSDGTMSVDDPTAIDGVGASHSRLLKEQLTSEIRCSDIFPGSIVAKQDIIDSLESGTMTEPSGGGVGTSGGSSDTTETSNKTDTTTVTNSDGEEETLEINVEAPKIKQFFYGMAIDIDPFQSNLFSGWINMTDTDAVKGSLDWWNKWLRESSYIYQVDRDKILRYLTGNYAFEMNQNDYIVLDIPTIADIQKEYDQEDVIATANWITTVFTILGFLVIAYSVLMLGAWVYDTNVAAGPRLTGLLTGGRWEAIRGSDELPFMDKNSKHYMTFSKILKAAVFLIGVGMVIIFVDIVSVVDTLVLMFGKLAEVLSNAIKGI